MSSNDEELWREFELIRERFETHLVDDLIHKIDVYMYTKEGDSILVVVDFKNYPAKPEISIKEVPMRLRSTAEHFHVTQQISLLSNWSSDGKMHVANTLHDIAKRFEDIARLVTEFDVLKEQFKSTEINPVSLQVQLQSYGSQIYSLTVDCEEFPNRPRIMFERQDIDLSNTNSLIKWGQETHLVDLVKESEYHINQINRIPFELELMKTICDTGYDETERTMNFKIVGRERFEGQIFCFSAALPDGYPKIPPKINLITAIPDPSLEQSILKILKESEIKWNPNWFLEDIVVKVDTIISNTAIKYSCIVCRHPIEELENAIRCPNCSRPFHNACWKELKQKFGRCPRCQTPV
jgi:hypothetical protein